MPSAGRLAEALEKRCAMAAEAIARAETPAALLGAQVSLLRSLAVLAAQVDAEAADAIVKRAAQHAAEDAGELRALVLERASASPRPDANDGREAGPR